MYEFMYKCMYMYSKLVYVCIYLFDPEPQRIAVVVAYILHQQLKILATGHMLGHTYMSEFKDIQKRRKTQPYTYT